MRAYVWFDSFEITGCTDMKPGTIDYCPGVSVIRGSRPS